MIRSQRNEMNDLIEIDLRRLRCVGGISIIQLFSPAFADISAGMSYVRCCGCRLFNKCYLRDQGVFEKG